VPFLFQGFAAGSGGARARKEIKFRAKPENGVFAAFPRDGRASTGLPSKGWTGNC